MTQVPTLTLNDGVEIPQLGFGTWQIPAEDAQSVVEHAISTGYRHIDTAAAYKNEEGVGAALKASGVARDELFVTTKLWNADQGYESTLKAFDASMEKLGIDVLDLYLIHWPTPARELYLDTWRAFEKLKADGRVRSIGVSNFQPAHLDALAAKSEVVPSVNQIELHPFLTQQGLRDYHRAHGIHTEAWSPLAQGGELLKHDAVAEIAGRHGKTPAQAILRWHLQIGNIIFPKSVTASRVEENFDVFDFELSSEDITVLEGLNKNERTGPDPDEFNQA
ncbi:aldo/keto reductase [Patulibacter americanus]|uniref:aldo/keto reductase n=1 Tax=Patulibacter americanus TaxID=588672 RepID=UPI0003B47F7A|nr:aldo/keto reductase [Patulibacter americanus]